MFYPLHKLLRHCSLFNNIPTKKEEKWHFSPLPEYLDREYKKSSCEHEDIPNKPKEDYWIYLKDGCVLELELPPSVHVKYLPFHLELNCFEDIEIYLHLDYSEQTFVDFRLNIILQEHVNLKTYYCHEGGKGSFIVNVSHIKLEPYATLLQTQTQNLSSDAVFILDNKIHLDTFSSVNNFSLLNEGEYIHNFIHADLHYQSKIDITSLLLSHNRQKSLFSCDINHLSDKSTSEVLSKQVVRDTSTCVFDATTKIFKETKATQAKQASHALLLDEGAHIHSKPHLEIYSDDLSASHGSTIGELDQEAISYLRSRGVNEQRSKEILINAFINDILEKIEEPRHKELIINRLGGGDE